MRRVLGLCGAALFTATLLASAGCNNNPSGEEVIYRGKPIKTWIKGLKSPSEDERRAAEANLALVGPDDKEIVPGLVDCLRDEDPFVRKNAAILLGNIGPNAQSALPALAALHTDRNRTVFQAALQARRRIDRRPDQKK